MYRSVFLCWACGCLTLLGCEAEDAPGSQGAVAETGRSVKEGPTTARAAGPIRLEPRSGWVRLNPEGPALFSPQISPDGRWVAAAGRGGRGLFLAAVAGRAPVRVVDPLRQGPWAWSGRPVALHFERAGGAGALRSYDPDRGRLSSLGALRPWHRPFDQELGELLQEGPAGRWHHHPRHGTVTHEPAGKRPRLVTDEDAWGAVVSPEGRYVAYSRGLLADSRLFVHDAVRGLTRELGPGVHPVWLPGRDAVIYAAPSGVERHQGVANVTGSELWIYVFGTGEHRALTATPDLVEMEPVLGPEGDSLVWTDWQTGGLWRAALWGGGRP